MSEQKLTELSRFTLASQRTRVIRVIRASIEAPIKLKAALSLPFLPLVNGDHSKRLCVDTRTEVSPQCHTESVQHLACMTTDVAWWCKGDCERMLIRAVCAARDEWRSRARLTMGMSYHQLRMQTIYVRMCTYVCHEYPTVHYTCA